MRLTFLTVLILCSQLLVCQITSFPHTQDFEQVFTTGTDVTFIAHWEGNQVATSNRIFQGNDGRNGSMSLNIIPTSTFSAEILISLDMTSLSGGKISFYAFSKENSSTSTRPVLLYFSSSIDGGNTYLDNVQIGNDNSFPNDNSTSYSQFTYEMPGEVANESNVMLKIRATRGPGRGSAAELIIDDFSIEEKLPALSISSLSILNEQAIQVAFNQAVETTSAESTSNYALNYGFGEPSTAIQDANDAALVTLTFDKAFVNNTYALTVNNVANINASSTANELRSSIKNETQTYPRQLVINEVFADPTGNSPPSPEVLPSSSSAEFIELYNTSNETIELTDFSIIGGIIPNFALAPNDYVILTSSSNQSAYEEFGTTVAVSAWNTLSNGGEYISLYDQLGNLIDSLTFNSSWYKDDNKSDGAWSLEQINPTLSCSGLSNWTASTSSIGGTPGAINSTYDNTPDSTAPSLDSVIINSPTEITLLLSELIEASSINPSNFGLSGGIDVIGAELRPSLSAVDLTLSKGMVSGTLYTLSVNDMLDCAGNTNTQTDIEFLFDNEPPLLNRLIYKTPTIIDLLFDEPVLRSSAETVVNYQIDNNIGQPLRAELNELDSKRVRLNLSNELFVGDEYVLTINALEDTLGNTINDQVKIFSFQNSLDTIIVISSQLLDVYFDDELKGIQTSVSNFILDDISNPIAATIDDANPKLIHLSFDESFTANRSQEINFEGLQNSEGDYMQVLNSEFVYDTDDPDLLDLMVLDANNIQLNFDEKLDQSNAEIINHYSVNNNLGLPESASLINGGASVLLHYTTSFEQEVENQITYTGIEDLSGNRISTNRRTSFTYDTLPPRFDSLIVYSPRELMLSFSENLDKVAAENLNNYSIDNGIGIPTEAILQDSIQNKVLLRFSTLGNNEVNTLTISNQKDLFSNELDTNITATFSSYTPSFGNFEILSDTSIQIQFTKELTKSSSEFIENYGFDNGIGAKKITQGADPSLVEIHLTAQLEEDIRYRLVVDSLEDVYGNFIPPTSYDFSFSDQLQAIEVLSPSSIRLLFDVQLDESIAENPANYHIDNEAGQPISALMNPSDPSQITLTLAKNLMESGEYELYISNLKNLFGARIPHSSSTFIYDVTPPVVTGISSIYNNEIEIAFNEELDGTTALALNHYNLDKGIGQPIDVRFSNDNRSAVALIFDTNLTDGWTYQLTVDRVEDKHGKAISMTDVDFTFEGLTEPAFRDIVFNEVYFDVDASTNLAPHEFVEIYNLSNEDIQLRDFKLTDGSDTSIFENNWLRSNSLLVLSNGSGAKAFEGFALANFPNLSNNGETLYLLNRSNQIIDSLAFSKNLYNDPLKNSGGYSIELINPLKPCFDDANYGASRDLSGGTPNRVNSIYNSSNDESAPSVTRLNPATTRQIKIEFNEAMDVSSLIPSNFNVSGVNISSIDIANAFGKEVWLNLESPFERGSTQTLSINNVKDCSGNSLTTQLPFELGAFPANHELLITEIMATPSPSFGLPEVEYVEIYNNSSKVIALNDLYLADNAARYRIGDFNIQPRNYVILTQSNDASQFSSYGNALGLNSFPTFTYDDVARLELEDSTVIFQVDYDRSFFKDELKEDGGYSLEMIRFDPACQSPDNWAASKANVGGTPGQENSIYQAEEDTAAPEIITFKVINDSTFYLRFSEAMNLSTLNPNHFIFNPDLLIEHIEVQDDYGYEVLINLNSPIVGGFEYDLSFGAITDCAGNLLTSQTFSFAKGREPQLYELIITEVMADPNPAVGLPASEYVEIYNTTQDILSLANVVFADAVGATRLPDTVIYPGHYLTLVPNSVRDQFDSNSIGLFNWPNLNADEETLKLFNAGNEEIFKLRYNAQWYRNDQKAQGGYSIEMIDLTYPCVEENNWSASVNANGGTPGKVNSINGSNPDVEGPQLLEAKMLDPGAIELLFSERLSSSNINLTDFNLDNGIDIIAFTLDESERKVSLYTSSDLQKNTVYQVTVTDLTDCSGNPIDNLSNQISLIIPATAEAKDILVNEVLFNPRTGGARFVEFYNNSDKYINLIGWRLSGLNNNRIISEQDLIIAPQSFFAITDDLADIKAQYPSTIEEVFIQISTMPSMRDDRGAAILLNSENIEIDRFDYNESLHSPLLADKEGVSLERISLLVDSNIENNWISASSSTNYASPGYANSQVLNNEASDVTLNIEPKSFSPDITGTANFTSLNYRFNEPGNVLNVSVYDVSGNLVKRIAQNKLIGSNAFFTWDGTKENGTRARIGYYLVLTEIIKANGQISYIKGKVAIGGRF